MTKPEGWTDILPVVIYDNLDAHDSVVLILDPKQMQHKAHKAIGVWLEKVVVWQALDDFEKRMTQFLLNMIQDSKLNRVLRLKGIRKG